MKTWVSVLLLSRTSFMPFSKFLQSLVHHLLHYYPENLEPIKRIIRNMLIFKVI